MAFSSKRIKFFNLHLVITVFLKASDCHNDFSCEHTGSSSRPFSVQFKGDLCHRATCWSQINTKLGICVQGEFKEALLACRLSAQPRMFVLEMISWSWNSRTGQIKWSSEHHMQLTETAFIFLSLKRWCSRWLLSNHYIQLQYKTRCNNFKRSTFSCPCIMQHRVN